jgi:sigma-B regulation protein RsbU (phosphoserine phosphatase)
MDSESKAPKRWLRSLRTLIDSSLTRLDFDDMLVALLDRVRKVLEADTAAILLLDEESQMLVARAASGIEEEVYQNVQVPVGLGFAGRIAAKRRSVMLDTVDSSTVANPILWQKGIRSMLGVPLITGDSMVGVLHVGRLNEHRFTQEDADLLGVVAERVVVALQAGLLKTERAASAILERSLVPTALPEVPGFEFAARYVPAIERGVGGDWYDVFQLPTGELWVSVGDVAGHGLRAAVVMGRLRTMIRVHAFEGRRPNEVLQLTDQEFQFFDPEETATAIVAAVSPTSPELHISSAGHPPPLLAFPRREAQFAELEPEPLLGVEPDVPRSTAEVHFPPGALLVLYTDGLIERRGERLADRLDRLREVVSADGPEVVCRRIMFRLVGEKSPLDDIAVVAARRSPPQGRGKQSESPLARRA